MLNCVVVLDVRHIEWPFDELKFSVVLLANIENTFNGKRDGRPGVGCQGAERFLNDFKCAGIHS